MRELWLLTYKTVRNRRIGFFLSIVSIAISVVLLLGVDMLRKDIKAHFLHTVSDTDLIVAAPNGAVEILLELVFHLGDEGSRIAWEDFQKLSAWPQIAWSVPIALGDEHRGFSVVGTDNGYFTHYKYGGKQSLTFSSGQGFEGFYDVVVGADVARKLHYKIGDAILLSHGHGHGAHRHANRPFKISGILSATMTPNDDTVFVALKALEAIHIEWQSGRFIDMHLSSEDLEKMNTVPKHLSGILLGLKNHSEILGVQNAIDQMKDASLKAVIPAKALAKLWMVMGKMENVLLFISAMVFIAAVFGMVATMLSTLNERRREIAILRTLGARPHHIFILFVMESLATVTLGIAAGLIVLELGLFGAELFFSGSMALSKLPDGTEWMMLLFMLFGALLASFIPAYQAYKQSLKDGLTVRL